MVSVGFGVILYNICTGQYIQSYIDPLESESLLNETAELQRGAPLPESSSIEVSSRF